MQNHLLQLLCLVAMEPPVDLGADAVRNERAKILQALPLWKPEEVAQHVVRGQYTAGSIQGQEAPVVIYSMASSSPDDAPRGMEFLYSLNRLNVATSRAMSAVIVVGSAKLFEPECKSPRQMQLANALCGYREMATEISPDNI